MKKVDSYVSLQRKRIGDKLKSQREWLGISQKDMAAILHISPANLCRIESGTSNYTLDTLISIGVDLGFKVDLVIF